MAKRLTDTSKWGNKAFRTLPSKIKVLYLYVLDNCDCAGVMHLDLELIGFLLGEKYGMDEIKSSLGNRLVFLSEDKVIVRNYIAFQNGDITDSKSNIAKSVIATLNAHGLLKRYSKGEFGHVNRAVGILDD